MSIKIKAFYGQWKEVNKEKAIEFIKTLKNGMNVGQEKQNKIINEKHLKGITVEELLK